MNLITAFIAAAAVAGTARAQQCTVRREWGQMSSSEKAGFVAAVKAVGSRPMSGDYSDGSRMSLDDFTATHSRNAYVAHNNAQFLPYHRAMLYRFDQALQSVNWFGGVPYLDEAAYASSWQSLDLESPTYFGGYSGGGCLQTGPFSINQGFKVLANDFVNTQCLTRCGTGNFWDANAMAQNLASSTNYEGIRYDDASNYHAAGHFAIGGGGCGDMADASWSPRDPLFWLHHSYVDRHWWKWQNLCPSYMNDFEGNYIDGSPVSPSRPLDSWGIPASSVFNTQGQTLCYTYTQSKGDITYTHPTCPSGAAPNYNAYFSGALSPIQFNAPPSPVPSPSPSPLPSPSASLNSIEPSSSSLSQGPPSPVQSSAFTSLTTLTTTTTIALTTTTTTTTKTSQSALESYWLNNMLLILVKPRPPLAFFANQTTFFLERKPDPVTTAKPTKRLTNVQTEIRLDNSTVVTVHSADGREVRYNVPAGCDVTRVFFSHIALMPSGVVYDDAIGYPEDSPCPAVMHPICKQVPLCERFPGFVEPTKESPCQYATMLTDAQVADWSLNLCHVRESDCRMKWAVDKCNSEAVASAKAL
ncbi:hypothetical protein BC830DRAFT_257642 [Chytriomyces sp. MP71]|nr:hypothetical protein BC830DRAFT_257642 [Chytriomyces sp. MP71]